MRKDSVPPAPSTDSNQISVLGRLMRGTFWLALKTPVQMVIALWSIPLTQAYIGDADGKKGYYASFVGTFPAEDPQVTILVSIDRPNAESRDRFGGTASAPVFVDLAQIAISELGIKPPAIVPPAEGS